MTLKARVGSAVVCDVLLRNDVRRMIRERSTRSSSGRFFGLLAAATYAVALFAADQGGSRTDEERLWEQIEPLLAATVGNARTGDFGAAWASYRRALVLAGDSELLGLRRAAYCRREGCPLVHDLAQMLGKARSELDFAADACTDMADHRCRRWIAALREGGTYLTDSAVDAAAAQAVEITLHFAPDGDPRPWTVVEFRDEAVWAMVDTGASKLFIPESSAQEAHVDFRPVGSSFHRQHTDGVLRRGRLGVLHGFRLGTLHLERVAAYLAWDAVNPLLGMNILLRYGAVCFVWPEEPERTATVHLGEIGPCRQGELATRAYLLPRTGQPYLEVATDDGGMLSVLVDTGAISTFCKDEFLKERGTVALRFGEHPTLLAQPCLDNPYPMQPGSHFPVGIGMDTFLKFKAFGWELDPFRMYFLPKSETKLPDPPADAP